MADVAAQSHAILEQWREHGDHDDVRVAVEFECGSCCKKASNAKIADVIDGVLVLKAHEDERIIVRGGSLDKEFAKIVIIPLEKVSSVEISERGPRRFSEEGGG